MARGPITWQNVNNNFGDPGTTMNNAFDRLQSVGDGMQGVLDNQRIAKESAMDLLLNQSKLDMAPTELEAAKAQLRGQQIENQYAGQNAQSLIDYRDTSIQKMVGDMAETKRANAIATEGQDAFEQLMTPEMRKQAWVPSTVEGETGYYDQSIAASLLLQANPKMNPEVAFKAAAYGDTLYGDPIRDAAAVKTLEFDRRKELEQIKQYGKGNAGGIDTEGLEAPFWSTLVDSDIGPAIKNLRSEFKKTVPKADFARMLREETYGYGQVDPADFREILQSFVDESK